MRLIERPARAVLALPLLALLALAPARAALAADKPVTDLDRRATLALWNSVSSDPRNFRLENVKPDNVRRLDLFEVDAKTGVRQYAARFGDLAQDGSGKGFFKITLGAPLTDAPSKGWTLHAKPTNPAVEIWRKTVDKSDAERFQELAVRGVRGRCIFVVSQRRPLKEDVDAASDDLVQRHARLLDAAKEAGLFARVRARLRTGPEESSEIELGGEPPMIGHPAAGLRMRLRLDMLDVEDQPVRAAWYTVALKGPLADFARVEGATFNAAKKRYEVPDAGLVVELVVVVEPPSEALESELYAQFAQAADAVALDGLGIEVQGKQRAE